MITEFELIELKRNVDELLILSEEVDLIKAKIMEGYNDSGSFDAEFLKRYNLLKCSEEYIKSKKALESFIWNLAEEDLYNLHIAFSIGRLGPDSKDFNNEYLIQLEKVKKLCKDKYYIEDKFIEIKYNCLKKYLIKGINYLYDSKKI